MLYKALGPDILCCKAADPHILCYEAVVNLVSSNGIEMDNVACTVANVRTIFGSRGTNLVPTG